MNALLPAVRSAPPRHPSLREGLCVWLSATDPAFVREVAEELRGRLRVGHPSAPHRYPRLVSLLAPPLHGPPTFTVVEALAGAAGNLVAQGSTVVVAYPLTGPEERSRARELCGRMADVVVRTPAPTTRGIPVIYRVVTSGAVVEREFAPEGVGRREPPDIQVDGALGTPAEVSAGILDVLVRTGWMGGAPRIVPKVASPTPVPTAPIPQPPPAPGPGAPTRRGGVADRPRGLGIYR